MSTHSSRVITNPSRSRLPSAQEPTPAGSGGVHFKPAIVGQFHTGSDNSNKESRRIEFGDTFMVTRDYFSSLKAKRKPKRGDVLFTVTGSFGIPVLVEDDVEFCFQRHIGLIRPKPTTDSAWLNYLLLSPQVFRQADEGATGTAQKTVSLGVLRRIAVPRVPLPQQRHAVATLDSLSTETQRLESIYQRKLAALDELKKSLLHQAFSGQL
jgi:type I restriction enzyme S subunit